MPDKIVHNLDNVLMVSIETITACNLRCSYCPNSKYDRGLPKNKKLIEVGIFHKIIDELAELNWSGEIQPHLYGEPLLDERIADLVAYVHEKLPDSSVNLFSNGELLTVEKYRQLVAAGVTYFTVTQHTEKPSQHVLDVLRWREENGTDGVEFLYRPLKRINSRGGIIPVAYRLMRQRKCGWPSGNITIIHNGDVLICCNDYLGQVKLGNVADNTLLEIWNSERYRTLREELRAGRFAFDICRNCTTGLNDVPGFLEKVGFHLPAIKKMYYWLLKKIRG